MTLIIIKNKEALEMTTLMRYALAYIFERESMTPDQIRSMQESIVNWQKHFEYKKELGLSAVEEELLVSLENTCWLLNKNEKGELEDRKELYRNHGIDYRKVHNLPGAHKPVDFHNANVALDQAKQENPEDYS
jgi:hypothetical protein